MSSSIDEIRQEEERLAQIQAWQAQLAAKTQVSSDSKANKTDDSTRAVSEVASKVAPQAAAQAASKDAPKAALEVASVTDYKDGQAVVNPAKNLANLQNGTPKNG